MLMFLSRGSPDNPDGCGLLGLCRILAMRPGRARQAQRSRTEQRL